MLDSKVTQQMREHQVPRLGLMNGTDEFIAAADELTHAGAVFMRGHLGSA